MALIGSATMRDSIFSNLSEIAARRREINITEKGGCQRCGSTVNVTRRAQRTMYPYNGETGSPDDPNYVTLCPPCHEENDAYWDERWEEYYGGLL